MRTLITGASGFVGHHLANQLGSKSEIYGTTRGEIVNDPRFAALYDIDIRDEAVVQETFDAVNPDIVLHLAAQSHVGTSFRQPWLTLEVNIRGTLNVLQAMKNRRDVPLLVISSSEVYGGFTAEDLPLNEYSPTIPMSPYSVSKLTQELISQQFAVSDRQRVIIARPFNHIGPNQNTRFALPNFADQIARMEMGLQEPVLKVGNLSAERDFTDVRDIVRAYELLLEKGKSGEIYNIGSGHAISIQAIVDKMVELAKVEVTIEVEEARLRPVDVPTVIADASKIKADTGWQPEITFEQTLRDILDDARKRVSEAS